MASEGNQVSPTRNKALIRACILILIVFVVWFQLDYMNFNDVTPQSEIDDFNTASTGLQRYLPDSKIINTSTVNVLNISDIKQKIEQYNYQQVVYNENMFGPLQKDSIVIVVQVHDRIGYLRNLIMSLAMARGISRSLLVFSHDYYDEEINDLIQGIDFCMVVQIFYPYSIQTHPDEFPGQDPKDCPKDIKKDKAQSIKCTNAQHPDRYGRYREAIITQTKHHWWWKANWVFDQLEITSSHKGLFLFVEEDHYIVEDFIHMLKLMEKTCKESGNQCDVFSLSRNSKHVNLGRDSQKVEITPWLSNMGMAFNRVTWKRIAGCAKEFCNYDDYNWDWTFQYVSENCLKPKLLAMIARGPRLFHLGECGMHHQKANCDPQSVTENVRYKIKSAADKLYPDTLTLDPIVPNKYKIKNPNGGWGDVRDHELCLSMTIR